MPDMKNQLQRFIVRIGLFAICSLSLSAAPQRLQENHQHSGVIGRVVDGQDFNTSVIVSTDAGLSVTSVETSENGTFIVDLPPGNYVLRAFAAPKHTSGGALPAFVLLGPPIPVTVNQRRFTTVLLPLALPVDLLPPL